MLLTPSGIIDISNGLVVTSISLHSAYPGEDGADNELSGGSYARQSILFPAATTTPTRTVTSSTTWSVPANSTVAFYGLWNGSTFKAMAANGGTEKEVRRILTTGTIWCPGHGMAVGKRVVALGDWPSPFTPGDLYYVKSATADTLSLATTPTGAALAPATNNANTNMLLSLIDVQVFGGSGQFTCTGWDLKWRWTDAGPVVNPEPTGYRWTADRPIPPQEIVLSANQTYDFLQHLTGGETTSLKIVSGETELNALGITYSEQAGGLIAGPELTSGVVDIVMRASNDLIVDYTGQEFYYRVWTGREAMPRDDAAGHANTGYRASIYFNSDDTKDGVSGQAWNSETSMKLAWTDKGGDYDPAAISSFSTISTSYPEGTTFTINVTSAVKEFADGRQHYGFLIRPGATNAGRHEFYAREHATSSKRPKIVINGTTTLNPESDATLDISSGLTDATDILSLAGKDTPTTGELRNVMLWFGFDNYFSANNITSGAQITSAIITLTLYRTRTAGAGTYTIYHMFKPEQVASPPILPVGIAWPGTPTGDPAHPTVGLRDENLKYHSNLYWYEDFESIPSASRWQDWRVYSTETQDWGFTGQLPPGTFHPSSLGNLITGADSQFPELGTMTPMYPGQKSMRIYWPGAVSPVYRCPYESNLSGRVNDLDPVKGDLYWTIKSVGADGLFTMNKTFPATPTKANWKFGDNPFGERSFYPRGYAPVYVIAGTKMPLPTGFTAHPTKRVTFTGGTQKDVPIGPPYFAECVASADQNQFYLCDKPFGTRIVPGSSRTSDGTFTLDTDFIRVTQARRLGVTPMSADIKTVAKNPDGTFQFKKGPSKSYGTYRAFDDFWFRYYLYIPDTYQCYMQSYKHLGGADGQYDGMRGMGYGNGGSEADGIGGATVRFHSEFKNFIPLGELGIQFTLYTYCLGPGVSAGYYDIFQNILPKDSNTGGPVGGDGFMRWFLEFNRWHCIEYYCKTNSLVPNNEPILIGDSVIPDYNCVINGVVQPCPQGYACYNPIHAIPDNSIDPATGKARNPFGGAYPNTFRSPIGLPAKWANNQPTFTYSYVQAGKTYEYEMLMPRGGGVTFWGATTTNASLRSAATDPSFRRACIERLPTKMYIDPNTGYSDGQIKVFHNNREVLDWYGMGLRHVDVCKDGITPMKLNGPLMTLQEGGVDRDFFDHCMYFAHMAMASERIGPMKIS